MLQCDLGRNLTGNNHFEPKPLPRATFYHEDAANFGDDRLLDHLAHLFDRETPDKFHFHVA